MNISLHFLYKTLGTAYLSRAIFLVCKFCSIPLFLLHLSKEEYAVFALLSGLEGWFLLLDFGMGPSLQNAIAAQNKEKGNIYKTASIYLFFFYGLSFLSFFFFQNLLTNFLGNHLGITQKLQEYFWITVISFSLTSFGSIVSKMLLAEQRGHLFFLVQGLSHIVSFSLLLFTLHIDLFSLRAIIFLSWALPGLASTCLVALCFKNLSWKGPIDWDLIFKAKQFFILALFSAFISLSDIWILSHTLSLEGVIQYNVLCKLFGVAAFAYAPVIHSLMPIFTSLFSQGNPKVVLYMLQKQCLYWIVAIGAFTVFILYICPRVESLFSITLAHTSIIAFGLYVTIRMIADFCITALQAKGILLPFFYLLPIQAALSICLQYTLSIHIGVTGLITGMALSYVCTLSWALPLKLKKASL